MTTKKIRIDTFYCNRKHTTLYFDDKYTAIDYGTTILKDDDVSSVFLLEHLMDGIYNVVEKIENL